MVPTLSLVGLPSYSKVLCPYFNLIWSTDLLGRLSCSLCSLALLVVHLLLLWCREKISIALRFFLWLIKVVAIPLSYLGWKMAVLLLLLEKFLPSTLFWIQEQNSSVINCMRISSDKKKSPRRSKSLCLLILPGDGSFLWRKRATTLGSLLCQQFRFIFISPLCTISFISAVCC